jgi:PD-(D/E)XK endonuclease
VNHRYDLVIDIDGRFLRAQCKTSRLRRGCVLFHAMSARSNTNKTFVRGYRGEADLFLVYCADTEQVYAVDVEDVGSCEVKAARRSHGNNQEQGVRWAADYLLPA